MKSPLLNASLTMLALTAATHAYANDCAVPLAPLRVDFPSSAQTSRQHGSIQIAIRLNEDGRVTHASISQSSNYATLDRAARASALKHWRFDVARCTATEREQMQFVNVTYKRPPGVTVSGTLNRHANATQRELLADSNCHVEQTSQATVFACLGPTPRRIREASR